MCKKKAKGLRPFKGPNQKTFGTKVTKCAKRTPRGFGHLKVWTNKTFGTKDTKCAKIKPRDFNLRQKRGVSTFKTNQTKRHSAKNQKKNTLGKIETWMPERGETFFHPTPRHQSLDPHETKRTKPPEDNSAQERGETFFQKYKISARYLGGKQIIYQGSTKENSLFYINCLRATTR